MSQAPVFVCIVGCSYVSATLSSLACSGPVEVGVQGVSRHTQYLAFHLVKTMFIPENLELGTYVHTQYSVASTDPVAR